ncbi:CD209 antigen-like protein D isoform X2 [Perca flavescens]|uniref:CD209 antigen-like protein D isoform X2 n=1 Tax=Perca flavescens TaxID=8167 RepID=UPI00106ECC26|nr:CD209 antigen-like protein D isoform X2 [Perca flavescens]
MEMMCHEEDSLYANVPDPSARSVESKIRSDEDRKVAAAESGIKRYRLAAVILGLLCMLQAALIIFLLISLLSERDDLKRNNLTQEGWEYFSGSFYYISSTRKTWQESRNYCLQKGADLVIINRKEEHDFTTKFRKLMWIGLTDSETEEKWKWVDGTPLTESYWDSGEPNGGKSENCVKIKKFDSENSWNDLSCSTPLNWICEMKDCP